MVLSKNDKLSSDHVDSSALKYLQDMTHVMLQLSDERETPL